MAFCREAELLWRGETASDSLNTVAALMLFYGATVSLGKDALCLEVLEAGRRMAERLGLFGVPAESAIDMSVSERSSEWVKAGSTTAWGVYSLLT